MRAPKRATPKEGSSIKRLTNSSNSRYYNCRFIWVKDKKRILRGVQLFYYTSPLLYHYLDNSQIVSLTLPFFDREMNPNEKSCAKVVYIRLK